MTVGLATLADIRCPDEMRHLKGWLVWKLTLLPGEKKARKVPYYVDGGKRGAHGTPDDRSRLATFDEALAVGKRYTGLGFAPQPDFGITALDFDDIVGTAHQPAIEAMVAGTYAEFSPSGAGIHAFVRGVMPNRKSHAGDGWPYTFETFGSKGFVTFTGMALPQNDLTGGGVTEPSPGVQSLCAERFRSVLPEERTHNEKVLGLKEEQIEEILDALDPDMGYDEWCKVGFAIHHESRGEWAHLYDDWSARGSKYPGYDAVMRKWNSFGKRASGNNITGKYLLKLAKGAGVSVGGVTAPADDFPDETTPEEKAATEKAKAEKKARFKVIPAHEFARRPPPRWIIDQLVPEADLLVLYGESGSGKSFVAIDLTMAIARGADWRGLKVRQGRVVYIAAEGGGGFTKRLKAYAHHHAVDLEAVPFGVIHATPNLMAEVDVQGLREAILAAEGAEIVVVDTFAQVTPGANENAGEDMGLALKNARAIGAATGALVILVHHSGKDASKGARGWSGIRAAADAELEVVRSEGGRWIRSTKQKDGDDQGEWGFSLGKVRVGEDEDGKPIESCVVLETGVPENRKRGKAEQVTPLGEWERLALDTLATLELGDRPVLLPELIAETVERMPESDDPRWRKNAKVKEAIKTLVKKGRISGDDGIYTTR